MKVLVIIPAYNEEENILKVINDLQKYASFCDILVINDASTDNTLKILKKKKVNVITNIFNMGYSRSIQTGIKYAYYNDYDYVVEFDGDNQHIASYIKPLIDKAKKTNADIVIGSRYIKKGYNQSFLRYIATKFFSILIRIFCRKKITDPLSGMQCLNRKVMKEYSTMTYFPEYVDANLIIEMLFKGYKIVEVPVKMRQRTKGISMHSGIIKPMRYMVRMIYFITLILIIRRKR